jgi:hypothetical protein
MMNATVCFIVLSRCWSMLDSTCSCSFFGVSLADLFVAAGANVGALRKLVRFVAVCYRVARDCDGGEELVPVDLEADLAPQDFLDTFSSDSDA